MPDNILSKDSTGKFLYVEGAASNISYVRNNEKINVQQGIDEKLSKTDISQRIDNTINLVIASIVPLTLVFPLIVHAVIAFGKVRTTTGK